jgi:hypothetical protein
MKPSGPPPELVAPLIKAQRPPTTSPMRNVRTGFRRTRSLERATQRGNNADASRAVAVIDRAKPVITETILKTVDIVMAKFSYICLFKDYYLALLSKVSIAWSLDSPFEHTAAEVLLRLRPTDEGWSSPRGQCGRG